MKGKGSDFISGIEIAMAIMVSIIVCQTVIIKGMTQQVRRLTAEIDYMQARLKAVVDRSGKDDLFGEISEEEKRDSQK